jgi:hypothetical protein
MFRLRPALFAFATAALIVAASAAPSLAYEPVPTAHLVGTVYPKALVAGGQNWSDLGDLQATRYMVVTATGMSGPTTVTFVGGGPNGAKRKVRLVNGVPTHVDFGAVQNVDGTGELIAFWYAGITQTAIHLDIVATPK